jgi:dimethylargininase
MWNAITREVSPAIDRCELTNLERQPIDLPRAIDQHRSYENALRSIGVEVLSLPAEPDLPDSVFVEDAAVVVDECAIIARPGAQSRQPETDSIARALSPYRELFTVQAPGTLDGGDVLVAGKRVYIGLSSRSNRPAVDQVRDFLAPFGYIVVGVTVNGCLHLKSAVSLVAAGTLLVNPAWVDGAAFTGSKMIEVDPSEAYAANALWVGDTLFYQPAYPKTLACLEAHNIYPVLLDQSELSKAEGALTCCSLIFKI